MPAPIILTCEVCRYPFTAVHATLAVTCGDACRQARHRSQKRAARLAPAAAFWTV